VLWPVLIAVAFAPFQGNLHAQEGEATEGALFLLLPVGATAVGLGRAMTAMPGAESVWWNPAGLAEVDGSRFLLFRGENLAGEATAASLVFTRPEIGSLAFAYQLMDAGEQEQRDAEGNFVGTVGFRNHLGVVSMATRFWDRLSVGLNLKLIQSRVSCRGQCLDGGETATTFAVDLGAQASNIGGLPIRLGGTLAHAGPDLQFSNEEQADPLPTRLRLAAAYQVLSHFVDSDELALWVTTEVENRWKNPGRTAMYVGAELTAGASPTIFLRAGHVANALSQVDAASVGLGVRYERFDLGLAKSLAASTLAGDSEPVHISFGIVF